MPKTTYHVGEVGPLGDEGVRQQEGVVGGRIPRAVSEKHAVAPEVRREAGQVAVLVAAAGALAVLRAQEALGPEGAWGRGGGQEGRCNYIGTQRNWRIGSDLRCSSLYKMAPGFIFFAKNYQDTALGPSHVPEEALGIFVLDLLQLP